MLDNKAFGNIAPWYHNVSQVLYSKSISQDSHNGLRSSGKASSQSSLSLHICCKICFPIEMYGVTKQVNVPHNCHRTFTETAQYSQQGICQIRTSQEMVIQRGLLKSCSAIKHNTYLTRLLWMVQPVVSDVPYWGFDRSCSRTSHHLHLLLFHS